MLQRVKGRLNYANVMSTIAVVLAIGGGSYAIAGGGAGGTTSSIVSGGANGLSTSFENVRTLPGFGRVQARCDLDDNTVEVRFLTSKVNFQVLGESNNDQIVNLFVEKGETTNIVDVAASNAFELFDLHVSRPAAGRNSQMELQLLGVGPPFEDTCDTTRIRVLAMGTR